MYFCYINNIYFKCPNPSKKFEENVYKFFLKINLTHQETNILENMNTYVNYSSIIKNKNFNFFEKFKVSDSNILNREIEFYELSNVLKKTLIDKAMGPDKFHNTFIKKLPKKGKLAILRLFNLCLRNGYFPKEWNFIDIRPIPKPGKNLSTPKHFRPIALASNWGRVFQRILANRLQHFCFINNFFPYYQGGLYC